MSVSQSNSNEIVEQCEDCAAKTTHKVSVDIITESDKEKNVSYSREPYRITKCTQCGSETQQRMNNA
nr:hypothetical protein [Haladaptatus pallidirubidus]